MDYPSMTVSVSHKINLGNYESAEVVVSLSGIGVDHTPDDIDDMLSQSKLVYSKIINQIRVKSQNLRDEFGN